jgi:hypothetical protein
MQFGSINTNIIKGAHEKFQYVKMQVYNVNKHVTFGRHKFWRT